MMHESTEDPKPNASQDFEWETPTAYEMSSRARLIWKSMIYGPLIVVPAYLLMSSPFPPKQAALHYLSASGCTVAGMLGTAPAAADEPGYHPWMDKNDDGVACEPEVQRALKGGSAGKFVRPGE